MRPDLLLEGMSPPVRIRAVLQKAAINPPLSGTALLGQWVLIHYVLQAQVLQDATFVPQESC